jgi:tRNA(fMet)-specific endonuclease VapC
MIALDTNVVIAAINLRPAAVRSRLEAEITAGSMIGLPAIVLFELRYGCAKSDRRGRAEAALATFLRLGLSIWPFEAEDAADAGEIRAALERLGTPIGHYDVLIAAQARRRGAALVTANCREFDRVPGLAVQHWP